MESSNLDSPVFLIGPAFSGKSDFSKYCLDLQAPAAVLAWGSIEDDFLKQRIQELKDQRPAHWKLYESPSDLLEQLTQALANYDQLLIDSINLWLSQSLVELLLRHDLAQVEQILLHQARQLIDLVRSYQNEKRIIWVSSECGAGIVPHLPVARSFRKLVSLINQQLAATSQTVIHFTAGIPWLLKAGSIQSNIGLQSRQVLSEPPV